MNIIVILHSHLLLIFLLAPLATGSGPQGVKELEYNLGDGQSFLKRISGEDVTLIVGSPPINPFGKDKTYTCRELFGDSKKSYNDASETVVKIKSQPDDMLNKVHEYFVYDSREVWQCREAEKIFLRIYNSLVSIKTIGAVQYYDTVNVTSVNHISDETTVKIKELKYVQKINEEYVTVKYEGLLDIQSIGNSHPAPFPNLIKLLHPGGYVTSEEVEIREMLEISNELKREMAVGNFKALNISASGKILFMDAPKLSLTIDGEAKCLKQQGVQYEIPQHFKPEIYELDRYQNVVKFGEKDFSKYFTILERVVWRCTGGMDAFYQIENEIVSRTEVSKFIFSSLSLMEYVYSISLEEGIGIRFKEIKLFDVSTGRPIMKYNGEISYTDVIEHSSTFSHAPNHKDISFKLSSKAVYRTFISTHGYDLRIGSLVKEPFAADLTQEPTSVDCTQEGIDYNTLNTEGLLDTKIKVKINKNGMTHAMKRVRPSDDYFTITRKQVWKCSKSSSVAFLRVVNELKISKPVRFLETFDGVQIINGPDNVIRIVEIKYLDFANKKKVLSYGGKLKFKGNGDTEYVDKTFKALTTTAIQKSTDETVQVIGRSYDQRTLLMRDIDPLMLVHNPIMFSSGSLSYGRSNNNKNIKISSMEFYKDVVKLDTNGNEVIECEINPDIRKTPQVTIKTFKKGTVRDMDKVTVVPDINIDFRKYFKFKVSEVWECQLPSQKDPILRIVNRLQLRQIAGVVTFIEGVDKVWIELENDNHVIKMEDIRYMNQSSQQMIYFNDSIFLRERREVGDWMSGTETMTEYNPEVDPTSVDQFLKDGLVKSGEFLRTIKLPSQATRVGDSKRLAKITYSGKSRTVTFEKGERLFQVGSNRLNRAESPDLICGPITSAEAENIVYIPRVMELIDGKMQLLDEDTLEDAFTIPVRKVWKCENEIMRVFTALCAKDLVTAVTYFDGVEVGKYELFSQPELQDFKTAEITETIYIDLRNDRVLKYEGETFTSPDDNEIEGPHCHSSVLYAPYTPGRIERFLKAIYRGFTGKPKG